MYGVCPSSHSKGVLKSNELRAAWLRMKHTHSIQQPSRRRCTGAIEEMVHLFFDILVTAFSKVLMLEMGLCLQIINTKMAQDVLDLLANVQSGSITNQLIHCTSFPDHIPKCVDKLFAIDHTKRLHTTWFSGRQKFCRDRSIVYGHSI